jgi:hypothetical protein
LRTLTLFAQKRLARFLAHHLVARLVSDAKVVEVHDLLGTIAGIITVLQIVEGKTRKEGAICHFDALWVGGERSGSPLYEAVVLFSEKITRRFRCCEFLSPQALESKSRDI